MPLMILSRNPGTESEMWPNPFSPKGLFGSRKKWELGNLGTESGLGLVSVELSIAANGFSASPRPRRPFCRRDYQARFNTILLSKVHTQSSSYLPPSASVRTAPAPPDFQPIRDCASLSVRPANLSRHRLHHRQSPLADRDGQRVVPFLLAVIYAGIQRAYP